MAAAYLFFFILALAAILAALGMLLSRNSVYAVLYLIANFASVAILYLTLGAPFIALAQITVYAGAIMVLFLFVIMLLGAERLPVGRSLPWQRPIGIVLGFILLAEAAYVIVFRSGLQSALEFPASDYASPQAIGLELYNNYLLPFELTSVLLLIALVGAIVLTRGEKASTGRRLISQETLASTPESQAAQKADLEGYANEVMEAEKRGVPSGAGPDDLDRPTPQ